MQNAAYRGPDRRVHRVYVTRNTEYHLREEHCVAVRDRRTQRWLPSHLAVSRRLSGGVCFFDNGTAVPSCEAPRVGQALYFDGEEGHELVTSLVGSIERPPRETVQSYPNAG